jgi:hypothetical protein
MLVIVTVLGDDQVICKLVEALGGISGLIEGAIVCAPTYSA